MLIASDERGQLRAVDWEDHEDRLRRLLARYNRKTALTLREVTRKSQARHALDAYFAGELSALDALETGTRGTAFQSEVWGALRRIPSGQTLSYGALAAKIGRPAAVRAVGLANGANPIAIVVPCHRVIGANAALTGYASGLPRKRGCSRTSKRAKNAAVSPAKNADRFSEGQASDGDGRGDREGRSR